MSADPRILDDAIVMVLDLSRASDAQLGITPGQRACEATGREVRLPDYVILHRNCGCYNEDGYLDRFWAHDVCVFCGQDYGFNVPITHADGRLINHASCEIQARIDDALESLGPCPSCNRSQCSGCSGRSDSYEDRDGAMRVERWQEERAAILSGGAA